MSQETWCISIVSIPITPEILSDLYSLFSKSINKKTHKTIPIIENDLQNKFSIYSGIMWISHLQANFPQKDKVQVFADAVLILVLCELLQ